MLSLSARIRLRALSAAAALLLPACTVSAQTPPPTPAVSNGGLLYACVQDDAKIAVIDMAAGEVVRMIDLTQLGFTENAKPHHIVVEPDGEHWYVSLIGDNRIVRFDRNGDVVGNFAMQTPGMLAYDAGRDLLVASRSMSAVNPPPRISLVRGGQMQGEEIDVFFPRPHPMVLSADGRIAYTGSLGVNQLAAVNLETEEVTLTSLDGPPHSLVQFAISPDGATLVASGELTGALLVFDLADREHPRAVASVSVGPMAFDPMFAPDGATVWVPVKGTNEVAIVETETWTVTERIRHESLLQPHAIVFSADGSLAFVSNNNKADHMAGHEGHAQAGGASGSGNVVMIDTATREVVRVLELGRNVTGIGTRVSN
jgi:DNA-binding beta-propeller fold protein YncE